jgi:hypothetical protein
MQITHTSFMKCYTNDDNIWRHKKAEFYKCFLMRFSIQTGQYFIHSLIPILLTYYFKTSFVGYLCEATYVRSYCPYWDPPPHVRNSDTLLLSHTPRFLAHYTLNTSPLSILRPAQPALSLAMLVTLFSSPIGSLDPMWQPMGNGGSFCPKGEPTGTALLSFISFSIPIQPTFRQAEYIACRLLSCSA